MELKQVEILLEKYFEGQTSLTEEKKLQDYFTSEIIDEKIALYKPMFINFKEQKEIKLSKSIVLQQSVKKKIKWIYIAAGIILILSSFLYIQKSKVTNLDTFSTPEEAFVATQEALQMLSKEVNKGKKGIAFLNEYEQTKKTVFK